MKTLFATVLCFGLGLSSAFADGASSAPPPIQSTNSLQTCGPVTGTISAAGQSVALPAGCSGFGTFVIQITTAPGDQPFVGTLFSYDATTGGPRRLHKTGVGALQVSTDTLTGTQGTLEYRTCGGAGPQALSAPTYVSGKATVTIYGMLAPTACFINGTLQTAEEGALRAGKAFSASTGLRTVPAGQNLEFLLTNPASSGVRLVIPSLNRIVSCNNVSSAILPQYASLANPTTNLPTTGLAVTRRGGASGTASGQGFADVLSTTPQTTPTTAFPIGLAFFGSYAIPQDRTLEPGNSILIYITGVAVPSGLSTTSSSCSIIMSWFEESLN